MRRNRRGVDSEHPPNSSYELNRSSPQARGLVGWWPAINVRGGPVLFDRYLGGNLTISGATWDTDGLRFDASGDQAEITAPNYLRVAIPFTFSFFFRGLRTGSTAQELFGVAHNNSNSSPWTSYLFNESS